MCVIGFVLSVALSLLGGVTQQDNARDPAGEGCVATVVRPCSYRARSTGGVQAVGGDWHVEIVRGERHIHLWRNGADDVEGAAFVKNNVIHPSDVVRASTRRSKETPFVGFVSVGTRANDR